MTNAGPGCIVFSHANGFPAGTYRLLFDAWREAGYTVHAVEKYGHEPRYPVTNHWPRLRDQLIDFTRAHANEPVFLVGHSLGGYLSLLAAARQPSIARGVVLLDSPVIGGLLTPTLAIAKATRWGERFSPGHVSKKRRRHWPTPEAAQAHFASKAAFARLDPQVLSDYIRSGVISATADDEPGVVLGFRREIETDIYNTIPHAIPAFLRRHPLQCPAAFIGGRHSTEVRQVGMTVTERIVQRRVSWIAGTHLFPFERPHDTAREVMKCLAQLAALPAADRKSA